MNIYYRYLLSTRVYMIYYYSVHGTGSSMSLSLEFLVRGFVVSEDLVNWVKSISASSRSEIPGFIAKLDSFFSTRSIVKFNTAGSSNNGDCSLFKQVRTLAHNTIEISARWKRWTRKLDWRKRIIITLIQELRKITQKSQSQVRKCLCVCFTAAPVSNFSPCFYCMFWNTPAMN